MVFWYQLFRSYIIDRGIMYYEGGAIKEFQLIDGHRIEAIVRGTKDYRVGIDMDGENIISMVCTCPHAESGSNCKHMAAVLFKYEDYMEDRGASSWNIEDEEPENIDDYIESSQKQAEDLVNKIPVEKLREMMIHNVLSDESLKNKLSIEYSDRIDARQMTNLKDEIRNIMYRNSDQRGFIDWYHASDFTSGLVYFLTSKVDALIGKNYLLQAFELTNLVFHCIGNADMDDSDGGSEYVATKIYDCWKSILDKCKPKEAQEMKTWMTGHCDNYVTNYLQDYLNEFIEEEFGTEEDIRNKMMQLDSILNAHESENNSPHIYSVSKGDEDVILKRLAYMDKIKAPNYEKKDFLKKYRHFYVVREMEIEGAWEKEDYKLVEKLLQEGKKLDQDYPKQIQKYSSQLIKLYELKHVEESFKKELKFQLVNCEQTDLEFFNKLKEANGASKDWDKTVDKILANQNYLYFVCDLLQAESRYDELIKRIEKEDSIFLLDKYEKTIKNNVPQKGIALYRKYLLSEVESATDRNDYRNLMDYLRKLCSFPGGKDEAIKLAENWKVEFKRRTAMLDEMKRAGF